MTTSQFGIPFDPIGKAPTGCRPDDEQDAILRDALHAAGVELGAHDDRIVRWVAGWEWSTVATIASWIQRAGGSGIEDNPVGGVQHSGPDTKFCVLCLSGEHQRIDATDDEE
ncbi:hypothetical protein OG337_29000 [[Kitasatospora] papulosa]|uniref:hypothetical protein n=1 Tax=[Kitasatospora] papulosa TaxID=1464011 RepID=UPI00386C88BA|nr:hypothetical protein OG337_29000 [[Kitasatospora] papulosa]